MIERLTDEELDHALAAQMKGHQMPVREFLRDSLINLCRDGEGFSGKRPIGNSGWEWEIVDAFQAAGLVPDTDQNGWADTRTLLDAAIHRAFRTPEADVDNGNPQRIETTVDVVHIRETSRKVALRRSDNGYQGHVDIDGIPTRILGRMRRRLGYSFPVAINDSQSWTDGIEWLDAP